MRFCLLNASSLPKVVSLIGPKHKKGHVVKNKKGRKSKYKPYVEIKNHLKQPIKVGEFFIANSSDNDIASYKVNKILYQCELNVINKQKFDEFSQKKEEQ